MVREISNKEAQNRSSPDTQSQIQSEVTKLEKYV